MELTQARVKELFGYDPELGLLYHRRLQRWVENRLSNNYLTIKIDGTVYKAHRVIWLWVYGYFPTEIDHINRVRNDNRLVNLREVTRAQNMLNKSKYKNNASGITGISFNAQRQLWTVYYRQSPYKYFKNKDDAIAARLLMEQENDQA
tara:strand:+ start:204 stop:647 length:444 start_codon:yes stop_codon:yes gene_type:complete